MNPNNELEKIIEERKKLANHPNWNSWKFQLQNRIKGSELSKFFILTEEEIKGIQSSIRLNVGTTPYYMLLADAIDKNCPIRRTIIPKEDEIYISPEESPDPLHEERLSPVKG